MIGLFVGQRMCCNNSGPTLKSFFKSLHNERGKEVHENYIKWFSIEILWGKSLFSEQLDHFGLQKDSLS